MSGVPGMTSSGFTERNEGRRRRKWSSSFCSSPGVSPGRHEMTSRFTLDDPLVVGHRHEALDVAGAVVELHADAALIQCLRADVQAVDVPSGAPPRGARRHSPSDTTDGGLCVRGDVEGLVDFFQR